MKRFKNILCVVEPEKICTLALERAVALAENHQASLTVIGVTPRIMIGDDMPAGGPTCTELQVAIENAQRKALETLVAPYGKRYRIETRIFLGGTPFLETIREVLRSARDLVIKMAEEIDWLDRWVGSDDMHLLRKCLCPVWLIKPQAPKAYRRILAAVDVDDSYPAGEMEPRRALNQQILEMAASLALSESAELHVGHVWSAIGESTLRSPFVHTPEQKIMDYVEKVKRQRAANLDALLRDMAANVGPDVPDYLKPHKHLVKGTAGKEIPAMAKRIEADLIVMGTVARTGVAGFIVGNTAETILNQIECSVLAIKPPGFVTPVTIEG